MSKSLLNLRSNRGQVLVEYLLLMVIAVSMASFLIKKLVGRGDGASQGMVIQQWDKILKTIGNDLPECSKQTDYKTPNCPP